eukprot:Skav231312  [mRNA]  locus=scaffold1116:43311:43508:- [translate_table: standard]
MRADVQAKGGDGLTALDILAIEGNKESAAVRKFSMRFPYVFLCFSMLSLLKSIEVSASSVFCMAC